MSNKCKLIAELSCNFMGDMKLAEDMIVSAAENGADYVKFQTWKVENLKPGPWDSDGRRQIYEKSELTNDKHFLLVDLCNKHGVKFLTSCFNINDLEFIRTVSNEVKIPGIECSNKKLVIQASKLFDTVFVSTGACDFTEYADYLEIPNICLMHCVYLYPCPAENVNLPRMGYLKKLCNGNFGYSGHYFGIEDAIAAISMGATVIEKHFTIDRELEFRDNKFALLPGELKQISQYIDIWDKMNINRGIGYQQVENSVRDNYRGRWSKN